MDHIINDASTPICLLVVALLGLSMAQLGNHPGWLKPGFISRLSMREKVLLLVLSLLAVSSILPGEW